MKEFRVEEFKDNFMFKCIINELLSPQFIENSKETKMNIMKNFDRCVSYVSEMPYANLVEGNCYDNEEINDVYIGKVDEETDGVSLLYEYFLSKRLQYQKLCFEEADKGCYSEAEFSTICKCYEKSPITKTKAYIPYSKNRLYYLMNYNVADANMYAGVQISSIFALFVDFEKFSKDLNDENKRLKYFLIDKSLKITNRVSLIALLQASSKLLGFNKKMKKLDRKIDNEWMFVNKLAGILERDYDENKALIYCCFSKNIWPLLNDHGKIKAITKCNEMLAYIYDVDEKIIDYSYFKLGDVSKSRIGVGSINIDDGMKILGSMMMAYSFASIEKLMSKFEDEDSESIKDVLEAIDEYRTISKNDRGDLMVTHPMTKQVFKRVRSNYKIMVDYMKEEYEGKFIDVIPSEKEFVKELMGLIKAKGENRNGTMVKKTK